MSIDPLDLSRFLSLVLRHRPDTIGLSLGTEGWVRIDELIEKSKGTRDFTREDLMHVVETSDKKRFSISADGLHIRAAQGHSIRVDLGLSPQEPPAVLYHGTATRYLNSIRREGLKSGRREHVHLSTARPAALRIGERHGSPVILTVDAHRMYGNGFKFYQADNGVWLTDRVPPEFLGESSRHSEAGGDLARQGPQRG